MSDPNLPPEQWRPLFDKIGVDFGYRPLANRIGMNHTRLRRLMLGGGTSVEAVQQVADALGVSPETVRELRGEHGEVGEPVSSSHVARQVAVHLRHAGTPADELCVVAGVVAATDRWRKVAEHIVDGLAVGLPCADRVGPRD